MRVEVFEFDGDESINRIKEILNTFIPYHEIKHVNTIVLRGKIIVFVYYE